MLSIGIKYYNSIQHGVVVTGCGGLLTYNLLINYIRWLKRISFKVPTSSHFYLINTTVI